jgi:hypothetical protein
MRVSKDHSQHKDDQVQMTPNLTVTKWLLITARYRERTAFKNSFKEVTDENVCLKALLNSVILKSRIVLVARVHCLSSHQQFSECLNVSDTATKVPEKKTPGSTEREVEANIFCITTFY